MKLGKLIDPTAHVFRALSRVIWIPSLLTRLFVGFFFFTSRWAKAHGVASFPANFQSWRILCAGASFRAGIISF